MIFSKRGHFYLTERGHFRKTLAVVFPLFTSAQKFSILSIDMNH